MPDDDQLGLDEEHKQGWQAAGRKGAWDPQERLKDMDVDKVDVEILYTDSWAGAAFYEAYSAWVARGGAHSTRAIDTSVAPQSATTCTLGV